MLGIFIFLVLCQLFLILIFYIFFVYMIGDEQAPHRFYILFFSFCSLYSSTWLATWRHPTRARGIGTNRKRGGERKQESKRGREGEIERGREQERAKRRDGWMEGESAGVGWGERNTSDWFATSRHTLDKSLM